MTLPTWTRTRLTSALKIKYPLVSAPAAGHTSNNLIAAVSNYGGLGSLGAAMLPTAALRSNIREIQAMTSQPFAVNLFCRMQEAPTEDELQQPYQPDITLNNVRRQLSIPTPSKYTLRSPPLIDQVQVILEENVKVVSFTFGYLPEDLTQQLWQQGVYIIGTATTVQEALFLAGSSNALRKVDCVVAQGLEAGGHRGSFLPTTKEGDANQQQLSTQELSVAVRQALKDREDIAVVSAGGISSGKEAADYLTKGMDGVVMGTLFMLSTDSSTPKPHRQALLTDTQPTRLTRALTGRWARGIPNSLMDTLEKLDDTTIPTYDIHSSRTKDIVNYATEKEIPDYMLLLSGDRHLAGAKYTENGTLSATQLMEKLVKDINAVSS
ncbi:2-nitropropane dioxygenase [Halteromyces radiatus]|uniref:2-nitropropane dioxygenase n=1 Tax=Halteromyces radiatus TaxID=101107 RepID=UPI00221ED285|nr:2-nitropropane dioxygenase [Halteromyces radiatus]KAI8100037.1 2-nitropropane dioxygenase [Halteromyces radiatus]